MVETHKMLYQLENWESLDEEEKEAMETLKFIEKAHELLHEHDHLGLGAIDEHEAEDAQVFENNDEETVNEEVAVQYEKEEENAPEAAPQKAEESFEAAHAMNLDEEGKWLEICYAIKFLRTRKNVNFFNFFTIFGKLRASQEFFIPKIY